MPPSLTPRLPLLRKLDATLSHRLFLLVGPSPVTGRLLDRWMDLQPQPPAVIKLTAADNAPEVFLANVAAALQVIAPKTEGLHPMGMIVAEKGITELINGLTEARSPFVLLMEGYDVIQAPAVHAMVALLVDYSAPAAHLLVAAAQEPRLPLARWRARRQMAVVRLPAIHRVGKPFRYTKNMMATPATARRVPPAARALTFSR